MKKYKLKKGTERQKRWFKMRSEHLKLNHHLFACPETTRLLLLYVTLKISANRRNSHLTTDAINPLFFLPRLQTLTQTSVKEGKATVEGFKLKRILTLHTLVSAERAVDYSTGSELQRKTGCHISVISQSVSLLWTSMDWKWMMRWVSDGKTQGIKTMSLKRCTIRTSMMKNPSIESPKVFLHWFHTCFHNDGLRWGRMSFELTAPLFSSPPACKHSTGLLIMWPRGSLCRSS